MNKIREIIAPLLTQIARGPGRSEACELWGASRGLLLCGLRGETNRPVLAITATDDEAESLAEDVRFFISKLPAATLAKFENEVTVLPSWGVLPFEADSPDSATVGRRMRFLYRLVSAEPDIYIASSSALAQKLPPWDLFVDSIKTLTKGGALSPEELVAALETAGYESASLVTRAGEYSSRGGIVDIFSPHRAAPVRVEFFGDTIESLREFDPETQRSTKELQELVALPSRELLVTPAGLDRFERVMREQSPDNDLAERMRNGDFPPGMEFLAPFFYEMTGLFSVLPKDCIIVRIEPDDIHRAFDTLAEKIEQGRKEEIAEGRVLPEAAAFYLSSTDVDAAVAQFPSVDVPLLCSGAQGRMNTMSASWLNVRVLPSTVAAAHSGSVENDALSVVVEKLKQLREFNQVAIVCSADESAERARTMFNEHGLGCAITPGLSDKDTGPWPVQLLTGRLSQGFAWQDLGLVCITEEEIFGRKAHAPRSTSRSSRTSPFLSSFRELKPGDFVVHADYGVAEYQGLTHIDIDGFETDFLSLRYEPDAKLYVPLYSLDKVQKYIGVEGAVPKLDRLGAPAWARTKEKARKDILAMAQELVAIYAAREAQQRPAFAAPDNLYREFESAFPFEETRDQQRAIEDVLADMQRPRPMDRLVCGDVGYGKTEVALRAAFKAVEDGMQVAILAPTTLLVDQHFRTFTQRLEQYSVRVEMLSRFRTKAEQKETLAGLKNGTVDMVIGTHRLLSKDVVFRSLGLLVVDEEHKFGVKHKERIKEMKKLVDVLTLTATPIPRTLHLSLSGIRDLSIIQTPPLDRQAIQVVLARFGKRVIREAIEHELGRGGQVFFVHNRVANIERIADFIRNLVPAAQVGIAHGQLDEDEIEAVMRQFLDNRLNVLVTTTIIESGIDIPTANTIIINRADRFGLADLYQIKGRVGRGREKAFAYLLTPEDELLSDTARKRLRAIQELSELGAGFRIAAQDLESRGAGNLLGKQQSGHIAAVGIDLYTQMMEEAMASLRGEEQEAAPDTQISMRASAFIPDDYIRDVSLRLAAYKELSAAANEAELWDIKDGLEDRYGSLPEAAANLVEIMSVKLVASAMQVSRIDAGKAFVNITFAENSRVSADRIMVLLKKNKGRIKLVPEYTLQVSLPDETLRTAADAVKKCLQELA
jgi:transcription-repair coupling factor (superfamily II helicase)